MLENLSIRLVSDIGLKNTVYYGSVFYEFTLFSDTLFSDTLTPSMLLEVIMGYSYSTAVQ